MSQDDLCALLETVSHKMLDAASRRDMECLASLDTQRRNILDHCSPQLGAPNLRATLLKAKETDDAIHELLCTWRSELKALLRDTSAP